MKTVICLFLTLSLLTGCNSKQTTFNQRCLMCGAEWTIEPLDNKEVPPTIEWCFHDGKLCEIGLDLVKEQLKNGESEGLEKRFIDHCKVCTGCRCASFTPEEWAAAND